VGANKNNEESNMNKGRLFDRLNNLLDEVLQFVMFAQQAVPWLLSGPASR
jgi:hypothetical protein